MAKRALSVTLGAENVTWLKARRRATGARGVSEIIDRLVTEARAATPAAARSVVGTIDLDADDPLLDTADDALRALVETSVSRPAGVRERTAAYRSGRKSTRRG